MEEHALIREVIETLRESGFDAEILASDGALDGGELILERGGRHRRFPLEVKIPLTITTIDGSVARSGVVYATDHVSTRAADMLRRRGVHFIDAAGNAFLEDDAWYIDIRGRHRPELARDRIRPEPAPNLYSAKRAQVIFALLTWRELLDASIRTIAEVAGVSIGIAQSTTKELRRRSLWPDHHTARSDLIDGWAAAYPDILARSLTIRSVRAEQLERFHGPVLASGEAAPSAQMRATSGVVYTDQVTTDLLIQNRWRTDGTPNLIVRRRFWSYTEPVTGEAPPLLVYGDLVSSDDPRTRSVAAEYRARL